jgi:quinol monooxygenase YgiN
MTKLAIIIEFSAQPGKASELAAHLAAAGQSYISEPGTEVFASHVSLVNPDVVVVYERYTNAAAKDMHKAAPGYAAIRAKTATFLAGPPKVTPLSLVGGK